MKRLALMGAVLVCAVVTMTGQAQITLGLTIAGTVKKDSPTTAAMPDANGEVGPAHVVEFINGAVRIYDKKTGSLVSSKTSKDFWDAAIGTSSGSNRDNRDPRLLFDRKAQRWYASGQRPAAEGPSLVLARSDSADPTRGWQGVAIPGTDQPQTGITVDFDRLGYSADAIVLTVNQLAIKDKRPFPAGVAIFTLKKSDFLKSPPVVTIDRRERVEDARDMVPVIDLDQKMPSAVIWSVLNLKGAAGDVFHRADIGGDTATWKLERKVATVGESPGQALQRTQPGPMTAAQPSGPGLIAVARNPSPVHLINGDFWQVHVAGIEDRTRTGLRWWRIRASDNQVLGDGLLTDPKLNLLIPSLALDGGGNLVIACVGVSASQAPSLYAISGRVTRTGVTFDPAFTLVKAAETPAVSEGGRWGDYTTTVADPTVPGTFWLFGLVPQPGSGEWAMHIAQLKVAPAK